jgi:flagellar biosynthesis/type III secretory pathway chaperone
MADDIRSLILAALDAHDTAIAKLQQTRHERTDTMRLLNATGDYIRAVTDSVRDIARSVQASNRTNDDALDAVMAANGALLNALRRERDDRNGTP